MTQPKIYPLCETALTVIWGDTIDKDIRRRVQHLNGLLKQNPFTGFIETLPAYTSLTVFYAPEMIRMGNVSPFQFVEAHIKNLFGEAPAGNSEPENIISIPVCYEAEFAPDLELVATSGGLSKEEVIERHLRKIYTVYMMGFLPGFAYMGEVDDTIAAPRKPTPRALVEEGSVGIAGKQTGIYPLPSPGGWQIIGRTPLCLFDLQKSDPFLIRTGDKVQFNAITKEAFVKIKNEQEQKVERKPEEQVADAVVIKPGVFSTFQDRGRLGFLAYGVPLSGAMDLPAHCLANALAGNTKNAATIECAMGGLSIQFKKQAVIAVTGTGDAFVNGQKIRSYQPLGVSKNDMLEIRYNGDGIRTYIAVRGGFAATDIMNSKSACLRAGIGTALIKEEELWFGEAVSPTLKRLQDNVTIPVHTAAVHIRIMEGIEMNRMEPESVQQLYAQPFTLSNRSDRMGCHLLGEPLSLNETRELVSTAVTKGTIQLTPGGQLIVLMNDCQTTGGYPRVAQVVAADLPLLAQLRPGDTLRFTNISFGEAEELYLMQQKNIDAFFG